MHTRQKARTLSVTLFTAASLIMACGKREPQPVIPAEPVAAAATAPEAAAQPTEGETEAKAEPEASNADEGAEAITPLPVRPPNATKEAQRLEKTGVDRGKGRFVLDWRRPTQRKLRELAKTIAESAIFPELIGVLNDTFIIPKDIHVRFENCDEINAFYNAEERTISLCWELIEDTAENFARETNDADAALTGTLNATLFTFFHELGHALIHVLDLPITGREEDAVDQLATWLLLLADNDEGELMALDGAASFRHDAEAENENEEEQVTWGEHSLSEQRFFNIVCWVYGHNPDGLAALTEGRDGPLPDDRAEQCAEEWTRLSSSWERILVEHVIAD